MIVLFCSYLCFRDKENSVEKLGEKENKHEYEDRDREEEAEKERN